MKTTSAAGRTWHYSHALGRATAENNGPVAGFTHPVGVAWGPGDILFVLSRGFGYPVDGFYGDMGKRVGKTTMDEDHIGDFARNEFTWPVSIVLSSDAKVYVSDEAQNLIVVLPSDKVFARELDMERCGERIGEWGETGAGEGQFRSPAGIAFDSEGDLVVVDSGNSRVQRYTKDGEYLMGWGGPGHAEGEFDQPWGVAVDTDDHVYVADWGNNRIQKFSADGEFLMTFGSDSEDGGMLNHPANVAVDSDGDVYVTDWGNRRVQIYEPDGDTIAALYGDVDDLSRAADYVLNRNSDNIKAFNEVGHSLAHTVRFGRPVGITITPDDRIVITDTRGRLLVYDKDKDYEPPAL